MNVCSLDLVTYPRDLDLSNPSSVGLYATRSFFVDVTDLDVENDKKRNDENSKPANVRIGVWHVLPKQMVKRFTKELQLNEVRIR